MLHLKFDQHFKNHHAGKLYNSYLVNICFAQPSRIVFWNLSFYFCINVHKQDDSFTLISRKIYAILFCFYVIFCCLDLLIRRKYGFSIDSKNLFISSGDKPILTLKISVTNFFRFRYFADFDIKIVFLGQNSFEWIAFC